MAHRGKLIALEGIDGSGKRTQLVLLGNALEARGFVTRPVSFPQYETLYGKLIGRYLNGEFGPLTAVDPHLSALLYAGNRLEARPDLEAALATETIVLADRYIGSNLAHQTARVPPEQRDEFLHWVKRLEYGLYALPVEDLVMYLRVPAEKAQELIGLKSTRSYTNLKHDIQEADIKHLQETASIYDHLATEPSWVRIDCINAASGILYSPEEIHRSVIQAVESRILSHASARPARPAGGPARPAGGR
jgi:dTMP kinase